ncbi:angio-associated migratory cell protein-like [Tubulanus polymorphus]|uniref:angio-associated migratory cell protein-like n=1 Tax=Tubulanus polymorphus TaxID=672921 RepID=UPI003DA54160
MSDPIGDDDMKIDPGDIVEIIELDENIDGNREEQLLNDLNEMDFEHYEDGDDLEPGREEEGATAEPERDDSKVTFSKHKGSVFCVASSPNCEFVVTGGEDDKAYVWSLDNGEHHFETEGHEDSVVACGFSHTGKYLATGDMAGNVKVWSMAGKELKCSLECGDMEWMKWHPSADVLIAGSCDGDVWMWKVPSGECRTFSGPGCACTCGVVLPDGKHVAVGYENGSLRVWDLKTAASILTMKKVHSESVTCIDCNKDGSILATGSTDVQTKVISIHSKKELFSVSCLSNKPPEEDSVESVVFSSTHPYLATGTLAGVVTIWDLSSQTPRLTCNHDAGIVKLRWDPSAPYICSCTLDGAVNLWDARNGKREFQWLGHTTEILDFDFTRDNKSLVTASGDGTAKVFRRQKEPSNA